MTFFDKLLNFNHYEILAIPLFVFVIIASGVVGQISKSNKQNFETRKLYPELIKIYQKYFFTQGTPRGLMLPEPFLQMNQLMFGEIHL